MQSSDSFETVLWGIAGVIALGMVFTLAVGWYKGVFWEQELKARKRNH